MLLATPITKLIFVSMSNKREVFAVIMAGGVGTRFWPMSRTSKPKQFLEILVTGQSLIQMTFARLNATIPSENILVVTNDIYHGDVREHLPSLPEENVLLEFNSFTIVSRESTLFLWL